MKKFLAICLSLCLAAALFAVPVLAEGETKEVENADALVQKHYYSIDNAYYSNYTGI